MKTRPTVEKSKIFQVLSGMPKGALLHTHGIATGPFEALAEILHDDPRVFVYCGSNHDSVGLFKDEIRYLTKAEAAESSDWVSASEFTVDELLTIMTLPADTKRADLWPVFQTVWMRIRELSDSIPLWKGENSYFWKMLERLLETGVTYVEMKQLIPQGWVLPSDDGETIDRNVPIDVFMDAFKETVELFKERNPTFIGAKMVWSALKVLNPETVHENTLEVLRLMDAYPGYIAGFDLVGHEDTLMPISHYAKSLVEFREKGGRLLLHAGETIEPSAEGLFDAIAVGTTRIGHAYSLPKFPALMRMVRERGITIECCPLSNQSLGYVRDLKNHPGHIMLMNGLRLTISSDDAAIFGYGDLTCDFALVTKAWGLSLKQLKHLTRQSYKCTALSHDEQLMAELAFDEAWGSFLRDFMSSPTAKRASLRRSAH